MQFFLLSYASIIIFSIIVKSYASVINSNYERFICPPGTYFTSHPYPGDCSKYIECNNGNKTIKQCAPCTAFDKNCLICDDIKRAQCDYYSTNNNFSDTSNAYHLVIKDCSPEKFYSISSHRCLPQELVLENDRVKENNQKIFCPTDLFGIFPYPFSKGMYFKCVYGELFIAQCRPGAVYNILTYFCEGSGEAEVKIKFNATQPYIACPPGLNETFLHPFDCTKYISCSAHGTRIETCNYGRYSIYDKRCITDWSVSLADRVDCFRGSVDSDRSDEAYLGVKCSTRPSLYKAYPHPSNWQKYVVCENNLPKVKNCPPNQVFYIESRECSDKVHNETDERK